MIKLVFKLFLFLALLQNGLIARAESPAPKANDKAADKSTVKTAVKATTGAKAITDDSVEFQKKLVEMYSRTEKTITLLREQITQNQSAPFLADLFLQLGDLLSEKASVLYYQRIEKEKDSNIKLSVNEKANPIVIAEQEAIEIYQQILKEFPNFPKKDKVLYRLAVAHRAIDDGAAFVVTSEKLIHDYKDTKEVMQVRLLLGQFYMDQHDFPAAQKALDPAKDCPFPFERNSARHRLGIIAMSNEKYKEALKYFEAVAQDEELKEDDNPLEVSIKDRTVKSNVKRDALIDSTRAYTEVYKKDPDPIAYYSKIVPTEALFQETLEKLSFRYIFLKNELQAMKLLRNLCERIADPAKIVNTYREVLSSIPPVERIEVPPQEMQYVLNKYSAWIQDFEIPTKTQQDSFDFFETQVREMGTHAHDLAKSELSAARKESLYERGRQFYIIYLGFFKKSTYNQKIATDLADVYFFQKNYLRAGDLYLRIFLGEFGPPKEKETLIQNAILCLQKKPSSDFYEIIRTHGLLIRSVNSYIQFKPEKRNDPQLNFVLVKGVYEQGLYNKAMPELVRFIQKFPKAKTEDEAAVDLILDYYNTRSDFKGLISWSQKILAIPNLSAELRTRLQTVKSKAQLKRIDEQVKGKANYDPFAQGKVYLEAAMSLQDEGMRSAALEQALAKSKSEKDINTFIKVAHTIAGSEKTPEKRAQILSSTGDQTLSIGRYYQTLGLWREAMAVPGVSSNLQQRTREKILQLALMLKDWREMATASRGVNSTLAQSVHTQFGEALESAASIPENLVTQFDLHSFGDPELTSFFRGSFKVAGSAQPLILREMGNRCASAHEGALCRWYHAGNAHKALNVFAAASRSAPANAAGIEKTAGALNTFLQEMKEFSETGDPQLDIYGSLHTAQGYNYFAEFLNRTAAANPPLASVLKAKSSESLANGAREKANCQIIISSASLVSPINRTCQAGNPATLAQSLTWPRLVADSSIRGQDPHTPDIEAEQKKIFVDSTKPDPYLDLGIIYLRKKFYHHAIALAQYGSSTFSGSKDEFAAIQGCSLLELGLYNEAQFFLKAANDFQNLKSTCLASLKERIR